MRSKKSTRTIELTFERNELFVRKSRSSEAAWCVECGGAAPVVTLPDAILASRTSAQEMQRRVEAGQVHALEKDDGSLLICLASLFGSQDWLSINREE